MESCGFKNVCRKPCEKYEMEVCLIRDKKVGACNGCNNKQTCKKVQFIYDPMKAYQEYKEELKDSRQGVNLTTSQARKIGETLS